MLLASGPGTRSTVYEGYAGYVTTWVSPHEGHMTSIVWNALAPVLNSFAKTRRPPPPVPRGIRRERSATGPVVIAETDVDAIDRDQRNWLGSDAGPRAAKVSRA